MSVLVELPAVVVHSFFVVFGADPGKVVCLLSCKHEILAVCIH